MRRLLLPGLACCLLGALGLLPGTALGAFGADQFDVEFEGPGGAAELRAGAHPEALRVSVHFEGAKETPSGGFRLEEAVKDIVVTQIEGLIGNPGAVPVCPAADFLTGVEVEGLQVPDCPPASALGVAAAEVATEVTVAEAYGAVYNLVPPVGSPAKLGFWLLGVPVVIEANVAKTPPNNIIATASYVSTALEVIASEFTIWGTPADSSHDPLRGLCLSPVTGTSLDNCAAEIPEVPFLTMPRACKGPLASVLEVDSWQNPGVFEEKIAETHDEFGNPKGMAFCGTLPFEPEAAAVPTTSAAESAAGLEVRIDVSDPNVANPAGRVAADIEAVQMALPAGVTLNPSAAEGLGVCTLAQFEAMTLETGGCPSASKLGSLEAQTPILAGHTFKGAFYLAAQGDNPFGTMFAAYLVIRDTDLGVFLKLPARIETDEESGQILTTVEDLPPFPLERVRVNLRSGPRAPLITPPACGTYATRIELFPSSGNAPLEIDSPFQITSGPGGGPCPAPPGPFAPGFEAGTLNNAAGRYSPFSMQITRQDGEQDITRLSAVLPPGVSGKIAGIPSCPDAAIEAAKSKSGRSEIASPSCPAASEIGSVLTGAGVGTALTYVPGSLYLAGPYNGAPLSVVAIVPAVAGPFDVGTVVTRVALQLNPSTAQVEVDGAASDPIPHILEGVPLKVRDLRIETDRPNFTLNPTSCAESASTATIFGSGADPFTGADDTTAAAARRFQASSCASLGYRPKLLLRLKGATKRARNPAFEAILTPRSADANTKGAILTLPPSQFIDNAHISNPCTRAQFAQNACPKRSVLGRARAFTPLLDYPLEGPVYFRSNGGERLLPDVVADLGGGPGQFRFTLVIAILRSKNARVRTKVLNAPDAPVTKFVLKMAGGRKGLLENSENLCAKPQRANLNLIGQNGRRHKTRPKVKTPSCKKRQGKRRAKHERTR